MQGAYVVKQISWALEIVLPKDDSKRFNVLPKRWVVERTFAWFESYRRLSKDYEYNTDTAEAMIQIAAILRVQIKMRLTHF